MRRKCGRWNWKERRWKTKNIGDNIGSSVTCVTTKPKSASFSVKPPPPRRLSWFSSPGEAARQRERDNIRVGGRTKSRTMSIDQGRSSSRDCHQQTDKEDQLEPPQQQQQHHSHFAVLNHLRSSFKHYTSKNRNKEIGWQTSIYSCTQTELSPKKYHSAYIHSWRFRSRIPKLKVSNSNFFVW